MSESTDDLTYKVGFTYKVRGTGGDCEMGGVGGGERPARGTGRTGHGPHGARAARGTGRTGHGPHGARAARGTGLRFGELGYGFEGGAGGSDVVDAEHAGA
jgi:hypothetical protein